jgi:hypothetical protein
MKLRLSWQGRKVEQNLLKEGKGEKAETCLYTPDSGSAGGQKEPRK